MSVGKAILTPTPGDGSSRGVSLRLREPGSYGTTIEFEVREVLLHTRSRFQDIMVVDTVAYGRVLFLDGILQSCVTDDPLYHDTMIHPAMTLHGAPRRVLVGGTGEAASVREVLRHPTVERVLTVDLDDVVVQAVREHLPSFCAGVFNDPRVEYRVEDVQKTIDEAEEGAFDVIFMDVTDPIDEGPAAELYSVGWFRRVARALADDGILVVQSGEMGMQEMLTPRSVRSTLLEVFPWAHVTHQYIPSFHDFWTWTMASRRQLELYPEDLAERIARLQPRPRVYTPASHHTMLELPPYLAAQLHKPGKVIRGKASESIWMYQPEPA